MSKSFFNIFRYPGFLLLWLSQILSQGGERLLLFVLILITYKLTKSNLGTAIPAVGFGLPALLFGSLAGVFVDAWHKQKVLFYANFLRSIVILGLFFTFPLLNSSLMFIFVAALVISSLSQFFIPAETSAIPLYVPYKNLVNANSIFIGTFFAMGIIAFGTASYLSSFLSSQIFVLASSGLFALSALSITFLKQREKHPERSLSMTDFWIQYKDGIKYILHRKLLLHTLYWSMLVTTVFSAVTVMGIGFADQVLKMNTHEFGYLAVIGGLGMIIGIIGVNKVHRYWSYPRCINIGFLIAGTGLLIFALSRYQLLNFLGLFIGGIGNAFIFIPVQTLLQEQAEPQYRGRVLSFQNMILNFSLTLPVLLLGKLGDLYGLTVVFAGLGVVVLLHPLGRLFLKLRQS